MELFKKVANFIMPVEEEEIEEEAAENAEKEAAGEREADFAEQKVAVAGGGFEYARPSYAGMSYARSGADYRQSATASSAYASPQQSARPTLTVHTTKAQELSVQLYEPTKFDQVTAIADDLGKKRAVIVNYEQVAPAEQRRICDFVNGVCYVLDGDAKRVSSNIVLYVPNGIDVTDAMTAALAR